MRVPVVTKDGSESLVSKDELQYLIVTQRIMFFERSDGWAVIGRDDMRQQTDSYSGSERREHQIFAVHY